MAVTDSDVNNDHLETALANSHVLARGIASCMLYVWARVLYHSVLSYIYMLWPVDLEWVSDAAAFFGLRWEWLHHKPTGLEVNGSEWSASYFGRFNPGKESPVPIRYEARWAPERAYLDVVSLLGLGPL
jgi:hypothetical protein